MDLATIEAVEAAEAEAFEALYQALPARTANALGLASARVGGALALRLAAVPHPLFNRVLGLGRQEEATADGLERLRRWYADAGIPAFAVALAPDARPAALAGWLTERGGSVPYRFAKMIRGDAPVTAASPEGLRVERIGASEAEEFADLLSRAYGTPPVLNPLAACCVGAPGWHHYRVWDAGIPVACGALHVQGGVGWLGMAATLPERRGRGAQGALFAARLRDGLAAGARRFVTETAEDLPQDPNPSFRNMVRAGFEVAFYRPNYLLPA